MKCIETRVLIVGGGPAGATAGRFLAASGVDCIILERFPSQTKPCGGGIPCGAFEELDLPENLIKNKVSSLRVSPPKSGPFEIAFQSGYIGIVERREFDSALRDMAQAQGAVVMNAEFSRFLPRETGRPTQRPGRWPDRWILCEANRGGERIMVRSELVIAADGVNSRVRTALGMKPMSSLYTLGAKLPVNGTSLSGGTNMRGSMIGGTMMEKEKDCCQFYFGRFAKGGYSWIFPGGASVSAGTGSTDPGRLKPAFERLLVEKGVFLAPAAAIQGTRGYRIPLWEGQPLVKDKVLFAGDSAGLVMPFTFEGIYYAMRSGQLAAQAIAEGDPGLYRKLWRQRFRSRFLLMKGLWRAFLTTEAGTETLISAFRDERVQQTGIKLWLNKTGERGTLASFINVLRKQVLF